MAEASPLRVVIDDRPLRRTLTGVGNYIAQLLLHFPAPDNTLRIEPFVFGRLSRRDWRARVAQQAAGDPSRPAGAGDVGGGRKPWWVRSAVQSAYGHVFRWKTRHDHVYHEPNHVPTRCNLPTITTIHDLSVLVHPQWHPADRVRWYERDFAAGVRQTRRFLAASEFTRREMIRLLSIPAERIDVTYQAPRAAFRPLDEATLAPLRHRLDLPPRFFAYVGTLEPRKNLPGLLDAYAALPDRQRRACPLLIAGAWGWKADVIREKLSERGIAGEVRLLGFLHDDELAGLYTACAGLVWPTFYEGFGLPPLEAMACGAPVIVSNAASLPEVVGEAGVLLDPRDTQAWTAAMSRALEDENWRENLGRRGLAQAAKFSWRRCAEGTIAAYRATWESS